MRKFFTSLLSAVFGLVGPVVVCAGTDEPDRASRVLKTIDFEERDLGNREDLPMHWQKLAGANLPDYVNGRLARDTAHSGQFAFRYDLNGGSLLYRYDAQQIKVVVGAHYRVEAWVKTSPLPSARARVTAYFVDADLRPITSSITHSPLYAATSDAAGWKQLSVELTAVAPERVRGDKAAAPAPVYLVVELGLLQPQQYAPSTLGQRSLFAQDIRGTCWWDDVSVAQVPKVMLGTNRPGNIFPRGQDVNLLVRVNDRSTDDLSGQLVIRDATDAVIYQRSGALNLGDTSRSTTGDKQIILRLPELRPGWYSASLVMTSHGALVGDQSLDLVQLADAGPVLERHSPRFPGEGDDAETSVNPISLPPTTYSTDRRFGIVATDLPFDGWAELPDVLPFLSAGRVKLAVWNSTGDVQGYDAGVFDQLLERLGNLAITPTACLVDLPPKIANDLAASRQSQSLTRGIVSESEVTEDESTRWLRLLDAPPELWRPQLSYLISRHAQHLDRWQLGADGTDAFVTKPKMRQVYAEVYREFAKLMHDPDLAMPWPAWYELDGKLPATVALSVPASVLPSQLPLYISDLTHGSLGGLKSGQRDAGTPQLSLSLQLLDRAQYGRETQIRDLAQRVTYALAGGAQRIDLPLPFNVKRVGDEVVKQPQELLLIMRTLLTTLNNADYKGKVPIAENVDAFLFDRAGQGVMILWSRGNDPAPKQLPLTLGDRPQRVDLWGNVTPLWKGSGLRVEGSGFGVRGSGNAEPVIGVAGTSSLNSELRTPNPDYVSLDIGPMPVFLIDIDGPAAQLRASVGFDRPLIESSFEPHKRKFQFTNPYKTAISGTFRLKAREGWTIIPSTQTFSLNPGEAFEREVTMELPYNSLAGTKTIDAKFEIQTDKATAFTVPVTLNLGLSDVGLQSLALRDGADVVVQQMITNYGNTPINYTAFAVLPGSARQERLVTVLGAGRSTMKLYRFAAKKITPGTMVRSGLKEMIGTRILNDEVPVQ